MNETHAPSGSAVRGPLIRAATGACALILLSGPVLSQSAASRIDQPTAATLPAGVSTTKGAAPGDRSTGPVSPPSAISSSTDVMQGGTAGADGGRNKDARTDPLDHLPPNYKR